MSKKKGLSAEEKRKVILSIYHDKKEPFNLKEMENLASRAVSLHMKLWLALSIVW